MPLSLTIELGADVQGNISNPGGAGGLVFDRVSCSYFDPSYAVWRQSGAPFGSPQTTFVVASGSLPPGVSIKQAPAGSAAGGACGFTVNQFGIAGVPTAIGTYTGTFGASGAFGGDSFTIDVVLTSGCPFITLSDDLTDGYNDVTYSRVLSATNGAAPYTYDVAGGTLPTGLSLSSDGVLSGTPTVDGTYSFAIRATDSNGCPGVRQYTIAISTAPRTQIRGSTQIKPSSVTETELNPSVAGYGLTGGGGEPLALALDVLGNRPVFFPEDAHDDGIMMPGGGGSSSGGDIKSDGSVPFAADESMGGHKITNLGTPSASTDASTKGYVDSAVAGVGGATDNGFMGVGNAAYSTIATNPLIVVPSGTTLTFIVGIGGIGTGDATVYANVQLQDMYADDTLAVINNSLVSFGGQHLFGIVHITGLIAGKQYVATLQYSSRRAVAAIGGLPFMVCLNKVTGIAAASLETAEASSSGTFTDLATAGPSTTITIPSNGVVAVIFGDSENRVQTGTSSLGVDVSGATVLSAATNGTLVSNSTNGAQNLVLQGGLMKSRMTAGSTTFKLQYLSDGGSNTRYARWIAAMISVLGDTPITFGISQVLTAETRASTSYGALTTADSVTLTTGTSVLVLFSVNISGSGVLDVSVAVDVSGATTIAAADGVSNAKNICSTTQKWHVGRGVVMTVNAGSNTFALRYKSNTGTLTASTRILAVIRLN